MFPGFKLYFDLFPRIISYKNVLVCCNMKSFNQLTLTYADQIRNTLTLTISIFLIGLLIRFYEIFLVYNRFILPSNTSSHYTQAIIFDILFYSVLALIFAFIYLILRKLHKRSALWVTATIASLYFMCYTSLVQYFGEGLTSLSVDLFAYDFREINDTFQSSVKFTADVWMPILIVPGLLFFFTYLFSKIFWNLQTALFSWGTILVLTLSNLFMYPSEDHYTREFDYNIIANKMVLFVSDSMDYLIERRAEIIKEESFLIENRLQETGAKELYLIAREDAIEGEYLRARIILKKVIRESPKFYDAWLLFGRTYAWEGNYEEAHIYFREVLRRNPDLTETYEAIADLYYWQGDTKAGLEMIRTGLDIDPDQAGLIYRKARFHYLEGDKDEAIKWFESGVEIDPDHELKSLLKIQLQINTE